MKEDRYGGGGKGIVGEMRIENDVERKWGFRCGGWKIEGRLAEASLPEESA